jgi:hypothetical protein
LLENGDSKRLAGAAKLYRRFPCNRAGTAYKAKDGLNPQSRQDKAARCNHFSHRNYLQPQFDYP